MTPNDIVHHRKVPRAHARRRALAVLATIAGALVAAAATPVARVAVVARVAPVVRQAPVVIRVVADADGTPLANAEVIDRATGARALTRENGEARVHLPADGVLSVRVRQLGFAFVDLQLQRATLPGGGTEPVIVRLARVPFALPAVTTTTANDCPAIDPEVRPLALWALSQLREGAERYESFRKAYPFDIDIERRTVTRNRRAMRQDDVTRKERGNSDHWGERYSPGEVVQFSSLGFSIPILFLSTLGDPAFWDHHCVATAHVEGRDSVRVVRLSFLPSPSAKGSDWAGDALMDSSTSLLRRVEFHLRINQKDGPRRLEGFTTFLSPSSLIAVPESTFAYWWRNDPSGDADWGLPDVVQLMRTRQLEYRKATPPAADSLRTRPR